MADTKDFLPVGTILCDNYRIDALLNTYCGGESLHYLATNLKFNKKVVVREFFVINWSQRDYETGHVKCFEYIEAHKCFCASFYNIHKELSEINSPHFSKVYDIFEENETCYCVLDYFNGETLLDLRHKAEAPFDTNWLMKSFLPQVLDGLETIHKKNLLHLQIRPIDIIISPNGNVILWNYYNIYKLVLTCNLNEKSIYDQNFFKKIDCFFVPVGRVRFSAIELKDCDFKKIAPWTDFYSLGATLYNLATNQFPPSISSMNVDGNSAFHFTPYCNETFKNLVMWMMNINIKKRPHSVQEIKDYISKNK